MQWVPVQQRETIISTPTQKQKQTIRNTSIIYRHNYLSTNYNHLERFVQTSNFGWTQSFSFASSFEDLLSVDHNPNTNLSHTQRDNTLLVTFLTSPSLSLLTQSVLLVYSTSLTCTSNCAGLRSCRERNLAQHIPSMSGISSLYERLPVIRHKIECRYRNPCAHA